MNTNTNQHELKKNSEQLFASLNWGRKSDPEKKNQSFTHFTFKIHRINLSIFNLFNNLSRVNFGQN